MKRLTLDNAFAIAKERGGTCVSTEYINASTPMQWKCANSHEWTATLNNIRDGAHIAQLIDLLLLKMQSN